MGSGDFARKIFDKVFAEDITRLRSMEDMWKSRTAPQPLNYDEVVRSAAKIGHSVSKRDQVAWTLAENFSVFCER